MGLAIYLREPPAFSETFLRTQLAGLAPDLVISGVPFATTAEPTGDYYPPRSAAGVLGMLWARGVRRRSVSDVQQDLTARLLRRRGCNLLLANYGPEGVKLLPMCRALGIPLVTHFHGFDAHAQAVTEEFGRAYRALGEGGNRVVAVSEAMKSSLVDLGVPAASICVVRYGVDPAAFPQASSPPSSPVFFGVGRFTDKKAPYLTLLAFKSALDRLPDARLVLAGKGELLETVQNLSAHLGLADRVELTGALDPPEVARRMREATAFVQHSITPAAGPMAGDKEGTPVAVLEAMMTGIPIIASRHAGIGEVVEHGKTGLLFEERDVEGMSDALVTLGRDPALSARMGREARAVAMSRFRVDDYIGGLRRCLDAAAGGRG